MTGILCGIGVGVGDPEMLTIQAVNAVRGSDIICLPRKELSKCRAYQIIKEVVPELSEKELLCFDFEMIKDESLLQSRHGEIYESVSLQLKEGKNVSFLTIGDPTVYSTFSYIADLAKRDGIEIKIINGINSFTACAGRLGISLCEKDEPLHIFSGAEDMDKILSLPGTKVIMKCSSAMPTIKSALQEAERNGSSKGSAHAVRVYAVSECGTPQEKLYRGADSLPEESGYMMTVIIKEEETGA